MDIRSLSAAGAAGLAPGPRAFTGLAAVVLATPAASTASPDRLLAHPTAKALVAMVALQEWVLDKLPSIFSRLEPLGIATWFLGAGTAGVLLARRAQLRRADQSDPLAVMDPTSAAAAHGAASRPKRRGSRAAVDWRSVGAAAGAAFGTALLGPRLRSKADGLVGRDWPGALVEDGLSATFAVWAVQLAVGGRDRR